MVDPTLSTTSSTLTTSITSHTSAFASASSNIRLSLQQLQNSHVEIPPATLFVKVSRATHLYRNFASPRLVLNPYVQIAYGKNSSRSVTHLRVPASSSSSSSSSEGTACDFEFGVSFPFDPEKDVETSKEGGLRIEIWNQHYGKKDEVLGHCLLPSKDLVRYRTRQNALRRTVPLIHKGRLTGRNKDGGYVALEVHWEHPSVFVANIATAAADEERNESVEILLQSLRNLMAPPSSSSSSSPPVVDLPLPTLHCVTNFNRLSGVVQTLVDNGTLRKYAPFRTYNLRLWNVPLVFGNYTKGWNREYKAARQIYGPSQAAAMMRSALRLQNYMAYSNDYLNSDHEVHQILGMSSFFDMLMECHTSDRRRGIPAVVHGAEETNAITTLSDSATFSSSTPRYTYVILPDSHIHFSITSKRLATDFLSKHALHAGAAEEVVFAGEFFFDRSRAAASAGAGGADDGHRCALVMDNNSGTFAPPKDKLGLLKLLMQMNLGTEWEVLALDREDPLLEELKVKNGVE